MKKSTVFRLVVVTAVILLVCLFYKLILQREITVWVVLIALAGILPVTLMVKMPEKDKR